LMWDPAVGGRAVVQPPASGRGPVPNGRCFVVTPERFIVIFGSTGDGTTGGGSLRRFAWCDQENPGAWDYSSVTSQAGFLDIEPGSPIITALSTRNGTLFWTGKKAYLSTFLGIPTSTITSSWRTTARPGRARAWRRRRAWPCG
jgi:hypothetical protein